MTLLAAAIACTYFRRFQPLSDDPFSLEPCSRVAATPGGRRALAPRGRASRVRRPLKPQIARPPPSLSEPPMQNASRTAPADHARGDHALRRWFGALAATLAARDGMPRSDISPRRNRGLSLVGPDTCRTFLLEVPIEKRTAQWRSGDHNMACAVIKLWRDALIRQLCRNKAAGLRADRAGLGAVRR